MSYCRKPFFIWVIHEIESFMGLFSAFKRSKITDTYQGLFFLPLEGFT